MASESSMQRCRNWYARLIRLYPKAYREHFAEGMEQTFNDLCRERVKEERGLFTFALWTFFETSVAIVTENARCSLKRAPTLFFKGVISLIAIAALAVCVFGLPAMVAKEAAKQPKTAYMAYLFLLCAYILSIPFFVALYQAFQLLNYIDMNNALSEPSARALKYIKYSAITISALMVAGIITLMILARGKGEDIAGIVAMGLLITVASGVVALVAAVIQKRVQKTLK